MSKAWIETSSGIAFDILKPTIAMINIVDIAHSLSQLNRFTGHCRFPYPVSQHCRLGSYLVPERYALWFLLHDAVESYLGDMNRPLKHFTKAGIEYCKVERRIQRIICDKFGLSHKEPEAVKKVDNLMLFAEKEQLMFGRDWKGMRGNPEAADVKIVETSFYQNKQLFLNRFYQLYNQ
jgi:5'-deoxynucleotidase YfbR-like HD superfamily hydrolase